MREFNKWDAWKIPLNATRNNAKYSIKIHCFLILFFIWLQQEVKLRNKKVYFPARNFTLALDLSLFETKKSCTKSRSKLRAYWKMATVIKYAIDPQLC